MVVSSTRRTRKHQHREHELQLASIQDAPQLLVDGQSMHRRVFLMFAETFNKHFEDAVKVATGAHAEQDASSRALANQRRGRTTTTSRTRFSALQDVNAQSTFSPVSAHHVRWRGAAASLVIKGGVAVRLWTMALIRDNDGALEVVQAKADSLRQLVKRRLDLDVEHLDLTDLDVDLQFTGVNAQDVTALLTQQVLPDFARRLAKLSLPDSWVRLPAGVYLTRLLREGGYQLVPASAGDPGVTASLVPTFHSFTAVTAGTGVAAVVNVVSVMAVNEWNGSKLMEITFSGGKTRRSFGAAVEKQVGLPGAGWMCGVRVSGLRQVMGDLQAMIDSESGGPGKLAKRRARLHVLALLLSSKGGPKVDPTPYLTGLVFGNSDALVAFGGGRPHST